MCFCHCTVHIKLPAWTDNNIRYERYYVIFTIVGWWLHVRCSWSCHKEESPTHYWWKRHKLCGFTQPAHIRITQVGIPMLMCLILCIVLDAVFCFRASVKPIAAAAAAVLAFQAVLPSCWRTAAAAVATVRVCQVADQHDHTSAVSHPAVAPLLPHIMWYIMFNGLLSHELCYITYL